METKSYTQNICRLAHYFVSEQEGGVCPWCKSDSVFVNKVVIDGEYERGVISAQDFESLVLIPQELGEDGKILLPAIHKIPVRDEMDCYRRDICVAWPEGADK